MTSLHASAHHREIVSTHGFSDTDETRNSVVLWKHLTGGKYEPHDRLEPKGVMKGGSNRVMYSALSPDGQDLATISVDSLSVWRSFAIEERPSSKARIPFSTPFR